MTCHKCPHNAEIMRLRAICSKCELGDKCAVSGTFSLDNMTDGALDDPRMDAKRAAGLETCATFDPDTIDEPADGDSARRAMPSMPESAEEYVLELLRRFASLTLADVLVLHGLLKGWSILRMADRYGESKQNIWARVESAIRRHSWIAPLAKSIKLLDWRSGAEIASDRHNDATDGDRVGATWVKAITTHKGADGREQQQLLLDLFAETGEA